jgi:hypothetical protein
MALDFAVPICFLAIIAPPMMRTLAHMVGCRVYRTGSIFGLLPYNLGLLVAAAVAMIVGAG